MKVVVEPWAIRFKGTLQTLGQLLPLLHTNLPVEIWCHTLLAAIATHPVGNRPDRFEPRRLKRRPKHRKLLLKPQQFYKNRVA